MAGKRKPDWTIGEFAVLLTSPGMSAEELAADLPDRSAGAIAVVREGVHLFHQGLVADKLLSKAMIGFLEPRLASLPGCAVCSSGRRQKGDRV